jgi:hypothetical protein
VFRCHAFPLEIHLPIIKPMQHTVSNAQADVIILNIRPKGESKSAQSEDDHTITAFSMLQNHLLSLVFVLFYEQNRPHIRAVHGTDTKAWPQIFQFAWAVRNGMVHHNGHIHFVNPNYPAVNWHAFSYSPADNGTPIFAPQRFGPGDFFMLLFDLSDELDAIGAPLPAN